MKHTNKGYLCIALALLHLGVFRVLRLHSQLDTDYQCNNTAGVNDSAPLLRPSSLPKAQYLNLHGNRSIVMFSGPSQSSTLISNAFISGLNRSFPYNMVRPGCPPEFLNPSCNIRPRSVMLCFGSAQPGYMTRIWQPCSEEEFSTTMSMLDSMSVEFMKENFANGKALLDMHTKGYPVFLAHRLPQHTFPIKDRWYKQMWTALHEAPEDKLKELPYGEHLLNLRTYVANRLEQESKGRDRFWHVPSCLAHYVHFFHLFMVALHYDIPHVRIETLLLAPTIDEIMNVLHEARICSWSTHTETGNDKCTRLAETIFHGRQTKTHMHSNTAETLASGNDLSANIYRQREQRYLNETTCHDALQDTLTYCGDNIPGCHDVNKVYGYNSNNAWLLEANQHLNNSLTSERSEERARLTG